MKMERLKISWDWKYTRILLHRQGSVWLRGFEAAKNLLNNQIKHHSLDQLPLCRKNTPFLGLEGRKRRRRPRSCHRLGSASIFLSCSHHFLVLLSAILIALTLILINACWARRV
ncbi:hypothetical protein Pfo_017207 [Paulownia fortunei]|nr:hypothetical protein Pfo_017207 [Paulownia fortunei]